MNRQIVVSVDGLPESGLNQMRQMAARRGAELLVLPERDAWRNCPSDAEVAFGMPPATLVENSAFRFVQLHSAGFDAYCTPSIRAQTTLLVSNARGVTAQAVAEHCLSMMFALTRRTGFHVLQQQRGEWQRAGSYELLRGSTLTILGTGAIGSALGVMCRAIGMRVFAVQRNSAKPGWAEKVFSLSQLCEALQQTRHLALAMPAIPGPPLVDAEALQCLPAGGYVYNVGRASALDYAALLAALDQGKVGGAGLDVFPTEPLPVEDPLWQRPDVLISPHAGGRFTGEMDALAELFVDNLKRYLDGRQLRNVVLGNAPVEA